MNKDLPRYCIVPLQVVPYGIESVNGSDVNMGCTSPLVNRSGVMVCESISHLVDGCSPDIDTSTSDWASQLVTVRMSVNIITFPHVLLTFGFDTNVSLTGIELDLFLCPEWKIDAPHIAVIADEEDNLVFTDGLPYMGYSLIQSSCDSLSNVSIPFGRSAALKGLSIRTLHIVFPRYESFTDWVHVGEVRSLGADATHTICTTTVSTTTSNAPSENISY